MLTNTATTCQHPAGSRYLDVDEIKCRLCNQSLTFPPRAPGPQDEKDYSPPIPPETYSYDDGTAACLACRTLQTPAVGDNGIARCTEEDCGRVLLLRCNCCKATLHVSDFYTDNQRPTRENRGMKCRRCIAFYSLARRTANPEEHRARNAAYSRKIQRERVEGKRPPVHESRTPEQKQRTAQANTRARMRESGIPVPKRKSGGNAIYLTQVCRIKDTCPLARFCVSKQPR